MYRYILIALVMSPYGIEAKHYACVCNDGKSVIPACGICGRESGTMERTADGVRCICGNGLTLKKVSCAATCKPHYGWTGKIK